MGRASLDFKSVTVNRTYSKPKNLALNAKTLHLHFIQKHLALNPTPGAPQPVSPKPSAEHFENPQP